MNTAGGPPLARGEEDMTCTAHVLHLSLKLIGLFSTSVNTSDGETLLLFAASVNRQMWRNS